MASFKGEFSFINKDAENISSSDHREAVTWHVMNRYGPFKRQRRESRTLESPQRQASPIAEELHSPLTQKLITIARDKLIPQLQTNGGLLDGWKNLSTGVYDCHDEAYLGLIATIESSKDQSLMTLGGQLYNQAIEKLEHTAIDERLLNAILAVFSIQTLLGHSDTARNLLKLLRGLEFNLGSLTAALREDILSCDVFFALRCGTRPLFPAQQWSVGRLDEPWRRRLGPRVDLTGLKDFPLLFDVMSALHELFAAQRITHDQEVQQWHRFRHLECLSRLLDHQVSLLLYPHQHAGSGVQQVFTCAGILLAVMVGGSPEPIAMGQTLLSKLQQSLQQLQPRDIARGLDLIGSVLELGKMAGHVFNVPFEYGAHLGAFTEDHTRAVFVDSFLRDEVECRTAVRSTDMVNGLYVSCHISWRAPSRTIGESEEM